MGADDEYEGGDDHIAENLADLDEELAEAARRDAARGPRRLRAGRRGRRAAGGRRRSARTASSTSPALPVVAIVGRPNVGKSALVNRILGRREAVVEDTPGVTRDRVTYKAEWMDRRFSLVDTGGWEPDARGIDASVAAQAEIAIDLCDVVLFVVDAMVGCDLDRRARREAAAQERQARLPRRQQDRRRAPRARGRGAVEPRSRRAATRSRRSTAAVSPTCSTRS